MVNLAPICEVKLAVTLLEVSTAERPNGLIKSKSAWGCSRLTASKAPRFGAPSPPSLLHGGVGN